MLKVMDLRKAFVEFFKEKEHKIIPSSSLLPKNDSVRIIHAIIAG